MFVVDRSALAVLLPIALLLAVVIWNNRSPSAGPAPQTAEQVRPEQRDQTVAANLPSR